MLNPTITRYSAAKYRLAPRNMVLEERFLHQLLVFMYIPSSWPAWKMGLALLAIAGAIWLLWIPVGYALAAAAIFFLFALGDWLLLWRLPQSQRSYGPIGPQLFTKAVPRIGATLLAAALGWLFGHPELGLALHLILQLFGTCVYVWGFLVEPFALATTHFPVKSTTFSNRSLPLKLLHLSDLHVERLTCRERHLLELVEAAAPDIIVITGDFLNLSYVDDPTARAEVRKVLEKLTAPYGVYATLGSPPVDPRQTTPSLFDDLNIQLLRDEAVTITLPDGGQVSLLGVDCEHDIASDFAVVQQLAQMVPAESFKVLLYHSPELMPQVQQLPIELYLCGHTHGGQIRMPWYGALMTSSITGKRYEMGRYTEQGTTLYISRGIGLEGLGAPRMRLLCKPEIILFTLSK